MNDTPDVVMTDHPAWTEPADGSGKLRVFVMPDGGRFLVRTAGSTVTLDELSPAATKPVGDLFQLPPDALPEVPELAASLSSLGTVVRFRTGNLWEAIGTAIIAQTVRDGQAKQLYRALCHAHGERIELAAGEPYGLFPTPEQILALTVDDFRAVGLHTKRTALQDAAAVYQRQGERWHRMDPRTLVDLIRRLPRVGPWTAQVAVTDWSNDWSLYPFSDLAVRTAARLAAPSQGWPTDERLFGSAWRMHTGPHLPLITVLTLAWSNLHADTS
jgi:DNA-3-methyladenine glycosylase II